MKVLLLTKDSLAMFSFMTLCVALITCLNINKTLVMPDFSDHIPWVN